MPQLIDCPLPTALTVIPSTDCPVKLDQVIRFGFQRKQATPTFTATTVGTLSPWSTAIAATDSTKIVLSPQFAGMVIPNGEILTEAGNTNDTINGVESFQGYGFVKVVGVFRNLNSATILALEKLLQETIIQPGYTNLGAYMFNRFGQIAYSHESTNADSFDVYNFAVGDTGSAGLNKDNETPFSFSLAPRWSRTLDIFTSPAFNPLIL